MQKRIGILSAYGAFWRHYADFRNRTSLEAFWKAWFLHAVIVLALVSPLYFVYQQIIEYGEASANIWLVPVWIYSAATFIPTISIIIRRLNDIDRSGGWFFLFLIPVVGQIVFFVMLARPSAPYDVYPGMSGKGPYSQMHIQPQYIHPYAYPPYGYPYPPPYGPFPMMPNPMSAARQFMPKAGTGKAAAAFILSILIMTAFLGYNVISDDYLTKNREKYIEIVFGDYYSGGFGPPVENYDFWGAPGNDDWGYYPYDDGYDDWNDYYGRDGDPGYGFGLTEEEQAAIDLVRESALSGFPDFTIEEVLMSRVDEDGLLWDCFPDEINGVTYYYTYATGYLNGSFLMLYAGFDVYEDGTIELYNLDDSNRDEYGEDALKFYAEWYNSMQTGSKNQFSA